MRGFSLVELSIVLVILGLLTGGILTGQNLIRAAELRSVSTQFQSLQAAINTFRDKYFAIPGDMRNATDFWGIAAGSAGNDATCFAAGTSDGSTCDGNGNGILDSNSNEMFRAWQQLANAGLLEGSYTGTTGAGHASLHVIAGVNAPRGRLSNSAWSIRHFPNFTNADWYNLGTDYGNIMQFGGIEANFWNEGDILTPEEVWNIDTKMDDGRPAQGNVVLFDWTNCSLASAATDLNADYDLQETAVQCSIIFRKVY